MVIDFFRCSLNTFIYDRLSSGIWNFPMIRRMKPRDFTVHLSSLHKLQARATKFQLRLESCPLQPQAFLEMSIVQLSIFLCDKTTRIDFKLN